MATGSKSARMMPLLGLAFLTSAISLMGPVAASGAKKSRTGGAFMRRVLNSASGTAHLARAISARLVVTIVSRIVIARCLTRRRGDAECKRSASNVIHAFGRAFEALDEVGKVDAVEQLGLFGGDF